MSKVVGTVGSVCPECLGRIEGRLVKDGGCVRLVKRCPEHGEFSTVVWRGEPAFSSWARPKIPFGGGPREAMIEANFSRTLSDAMGNFFSRSRYALARSTGEIGEIQNMMDAVYKKFSVEHGLKLGKPAAFSLLRYDKELDRLEAWCNTHLNTMRSLLTLDKKNITQKFFEEVAVQVRRAFERANKDAETWLRAIMAPMETQVREHQIQLKRRLESIKRIHQATDTLEDRIGELESVEKDLLRQINALEGVVGRVRSLLLPPQGQLRVA